MRSKLFLRIAAGLILLHAVLHTLGHSGWKKNPDSIYQEVVKQMTGNKFPFMGVTRSISEYYDGYGYCVTIALLIIALILWFISDGTSQNSALVKNISWTLAFGLLAWGIDELLFFFPFAAGITLTASALIFISGFLNTRTQSSS